MITQTAEQTPIAKKILDLRDQIVEKFNPLKIILFGSYAYGTPGPDSDVDLLVIMPFEGKNPEKATEIWLATKPDFPIDLMVRKPEEIVRRLKMEDFFIREVLKKGEVLYEAHHA